MVEDAALVLCDTHRRHVDVGDALPPGGSRLRLELVVDGVEVAHLNGRRARRGDGPRRTDEEPSDGAREQREHGNGGRDEELGCVIIITGHVNAKSERDVARRVVLSYM